MATLAEILKRHSNASRSDIEWLHLLTAEWQLIADLVFADLVLWIKNSDDEFIAAGHARPSSAPTLFYRDITGEVVNRQWARDVKHAMQSGEISEQKDPLNFQGVPTRFAAYPVRRRASTQSDEVVATPIAVVTRHTNLTDVKVPNKIQLNYQACGLDLLRMVAEGTFPDFNTPTGPKRGAPRANDGLLRLDVDGVVTFASPNGLSIFNRLGTVGELEGKSLAANVTGLRRATSSVDESLPLVLTGRAPWRADMESKSVTISVRAIPIKNAGERTGAIVLCRDVTDLRRQERELITKDATIREIHHRVKNNLQTVASLLRIQSRRTESEDAKDALSQAIRRVSAIASVHDTLAEGVNQDVNFDDAMDRALKVVSELTSSPSKTVRTQIDGKFGQLRAEIATPLAVVLTELVTNAIEHGLAERNGLVLISVERTQKQLSIVIADNGVGLAGGKLGSGLGTQIIKTLVEGEMRGTIHWSSPSEGGTRVSLSVPL